MALRLLSTLDLPLYTRRYTLDGEDWLFRFDYNERDASYRLDVGREGAPASVRGIVLVTSCDLLERHRGLAAVPPGLLHVLANDPNTTPPKLGELGIDGRRCTLGYVEFNV